MDTKEIEDLAENLINMSITKEPLTKHKKKPICEFEGCKVRIKSTIPIKCKCGKMFCTSHQLFSNHNCKYDYQGMHRRDLEKNMPLVEFEKIQQITSQKDNNNERKDKLRKIDPKDFIRDFSF
jgi:hypothetical protein